MMPVSTVGRLINIDSDPADFTGTKHERRNDDLAACYAENTADGADQEPEQEARDNAHR